MYETGALVSIRKIFFFLYGFFQRHLSEAYTLTLQRGLHRFAKKNNTKTTRNFVTLNFASVSNVSCRNLLLAFSTSLIVLYATQAKEPDGIKGASKRVFL